MSDAKTLGERIDMLETRLTFQDETIETLNKTITAQWQQIDALTRQVEALSERLRFEATRTFLRARCVRDEAGALEHLEMLRDGGLAHRERFRELRDRRLTRGESRENGSPGGIGERGEGGIEPRGRHRSITIWLHNS